MAAAAEAAAAAGTVLYRKLLLHERSKARHEGILRELVSPDATIRARAIEDLRAEQLVDDGPAHFTVLAAQCRRTDATTAPRQVAFEAAVEEGVRVVVDDVALVAANRSRAWILLIQRQPPSRALVAAIAERIAGKFRRLTDGNAHPVFGLGSTVTRPGAVATSYEQAFLAASGALLLPGIGDLARWGELGPYGLLLKLSAEDLLGGAQVPALVAIEREDSHHILLDTLTRFFDHGGNIQRAADSLCIHRATAYQRLRRVEQITGCSLDNGDDRLMLHLGLKLRAIAAAYRDEFG
jgi:hypothetical protein